MLKKIDYKILFELDNNARQSYGQIAEKVGTSKQVVGNHINVLLKEGYIKKFLTIFDLSKLNLILHKVYTRLVRASANDEQKLLSFLNSHPNVSWLVRTEGIYDLAFAIHTKDVIELNNILLEIEKTFGHLIDQKVVNRVITGEFFHRDYLIGDKKSELRKNVVFQTLEKPISLDEIDFKILAAFSKNSRIPATEIAKKVSISPDAVGKRVRNLEKNGVIKNYILVLNDTKLNQLHYKVLLRVSNFPETTEKKFIEFCRQHKNIVFYNKNIGSWEIEIDLEVQTSEDFREIMRILKQDFADSIRDYFSLIIYEIRKFDFLPMYKF